MEKIPASRPKMKRKNLLKLIAEAHPDFIIPAFFLVGIRGYYLDTMGDARKNDRNIYDDAIFLVGKEELEAFNGNTDPAAFKKAIANLQPGVWPVYKFDNHKGQYLALCQRAGKVTVLRDGAGEDTGNFGINIHKGGNWGTGSLGCQTIPPVQWDEFMKKASEIAKKYHGNSYKSFTYTYVLLVNNQPTASTDQNEETPIS